MIDMAFGVLTIRLGLGASKIPKPFFSILIPGFESVTVCSHVDFVDILELGKVGELKGCVVVDEVQFPIGGIDGNESKSGEELW